MLDEYKNLFEPAGDGKYKLKHNPSVTSVNVKLKKKDISFDIKPKDNTTFKYVWKRSTDNDIDNNSTFSDLNNSNVKTYTAYEEGWYKANISANKNRKVQSEDTEICRLVSAPLNPTLSVIAYDSDGEGPKTTEGDWMNIGEPSECYAISANPGDTVTLSVESSINIGSNNKVASKLYSDGIKYEWRRMPYKAGAVEEILSTKTHGSYISSDKNPKFEDKNSTATFSNHPSSIVYEYDGEQTYLTCYAINTLADRTTEKVPTALRF